MKKVILTILMLAGVTAVSYATRSIPWGENFDNALSVNDFTVTDSNADGKKWEYNSGGFMRVDYHSDHSMNDWLITPGFRLQQGCSYKFSLSARSFASTEKFEVFAGSSTATSSMTVPVIAATRVSSNGSFVNYSGEFTVPSDGVWHIGIHGCSSADQLYLDVDNLQLTQGVNAGSPKAVTGLSAVPDPSGKNEVLLSYTLPAATVSGAALQSVTKTEVLLDGTLLWTLTENSAGATVSRVHLDAPAGNHTYTVVAYNGSERGEEASASCFIGQKAPAEVTGLKAVETSPGVVKITWDVPVDIDGNPLNGELVRYKVVQNVPFQESLFVEEDIEGADNVAGTEFTHTAIAPGEGQVFTSYGVYAITSGGRSQAAKLPLFPVGTPYTVPYTESFAGAVKGSLMRSETVSYGQIATSWDIYSDEALPDIKSQDNDGGMMVMSGYVTGDCARLYTGKIDLTGVSSPALTFYLYNDPTVNDNTLEIYAAGTDNSFRFVKEVTPSSLAAAGWNMVIVPLGGFEGQVQFAFQGTVVNSNNIMIDNIRAGSIVAHDLCAVSLGAEEKIVAGTDYVLTARVANIGGSAAERYDVILLCDGIEADRIAGNTLDSGSTASIPFTRHADILDNTPRSYTFSVAYDLDKDNANNTSAPLTVSPELPQYPAPTGFAATVDEDKVRMQWTAPVLDNAIPDAVTDGFEDYEPYSSSFGGWITVDADGNQNGKLSDITFPGINDNIAGGQSSAFWILDSSAPSLNATFASHDGSRCMAQIFNYNDLPCDDWAVSPMMFEGATDISFFAKSYSAYVSEKLEILWSEGGSDTADFHSVETIEIPNAWTRYDYTLPAQARRFALRCTTAGGYMTLIDDVTYTPADAAVTLELAGYNLYRNGIKINDTPLADTGYTDIPGNGTHTYHVTALYNAGESVAAAPAVVEVKLSGIDSISADATVTAQRGGIMAEGITGQVTVYTVDGRIAAEVESDGSRFIPLRPGIYVVRSTAVTAKLSVR